MGIWEVTLNLSDYEDEIHQTAQEKGWWDKPRSFGDLISLMHSELSEALEEYRAGFDPTFIYSVDQDGRAVEYVSGKKPEGVPVELADCLIRILDMVKFYNIDLERALQIKMAYNKGRSYRHGDKVL